MDKDEIIQGEYIKEAVVNNIITRKRGKLLNKKNIPVAKISNTLPVVSEKIYTHHRICIRFFRDEKQKNYSLMFWLILVYLFIVYIIKTKVLYIYIFL